MATAVYMNTFFQVLRENVCRDAVLVKERCLRFMSALCRELAERLPENARLIDALRFLSPHHCIGMQQPRFDQLPLFLAPRK